MNANSDAYFLLSYKRQFMFPHRISKNGQPGWLINLTTVFFYSHGGGSNLLGFKSLGYRIMHSLHSDGIARPGKSYKEVKK